VKSARDLAGLRRGDQVAFQLHVTETNSWVSDIARTGAVPLPPPAKPKLAAAPRDAANPSDRAWLEYKFTNELGQAVSLSDFRGQALAITFFYTRCPLPDYCPRLSRNFQVASQKLAALPGLPGNWHFLSISFDPQFDSPAMLKAYGQTYAYDPAHWSFLTGPTDKIAEVARRAGISYQSNDGVINHNFRTLIVDAAGHLQMVFPTSGDLSDQIVSEMVKAVSPTNRLALGAN
jgi:protein SCO1/2